MAKKEKISIRKNEDLKDIDEELDAALDGLDGANQRIVDLLQTFEQVAEESDVPGPPPEEVQGQAPGQQESA
ncbi:MAG: hypothetical protein KJ052_09630 [Candidatus Hydrogenedentes bacterium]|nr:hypothetical protein [Candidatus Hydrogenedentota bacterium]